MYPLTLEILIPLLTSVKTLMSDISPTTVTILQILAGSIGWIGGLTLFVWWKEKKKLAQVA
jgi:hypothetical protein